MNSINTINIKVGIIMILTLLVCSCSKDIVDEPTVGSIVGSVADRTTGEPVATVNVTIEPGGSSTVTGSDGAFNFRNLEAGSYTLTIRKEGYKENSSKVSVRAGDPTSAHLLIERIPAIVTADREVLDFGANASTNTLSFNIVNPGYVDLEWEIEERCDWIIELKPAKGTLKYGKTEAIVVVIDRELLASGPNEAVIVVRSSNGSSDVKVTAVGPERYVSQLNTLDATEITSSSATLNGEIIDAGAPAYTERGFIYDTQSTPTVSSCIKKLSSPVTSDKNFFCSIDGLSPVQTYYARAYIVQNGNTIYGNIVSFTTSQQTTTLTTSAVTQIGASTATFNASILDIGTPAYSEKGFCYSKESTPTIADNRKPIGGSGAGDFSLQVTDLDYPVTYYVRAYAIQAGETVYGNIVSFTTNSTPTVVNTYAATEITSSSAVLNGSIPQVGNPAYTEKGFCISTGYYFPTIEDTKLIVAGTGEGNFSLKISNLEYNTRYQFRAYAIQDGSVIYGNTLELSTAYTQASVLTSDVSNIGYTSATFNGTVAAIGDPVITERGFCYTTRSYPAPTISDKAVKVSGIAAGAFKMDIQNLEEDTRYYVRAYVIQNGEPIYGAVKNFDTGYAPIIATGPAYDVTLTSASFQGQFVDGSPYVIECGFVYANTTNPTINTGTVVIPTSISKNEPYLFTRTVNNLTPYRTYYYRAYVKTSLGYIYGETEAFTTY